MKTVPKLVVHVTKGVALPEVAVAADVPDGNPEMVLPDVAIADAAGAAIATAIGDAIADATAAREEGHGTAPVMDGPVDALAEDAVGAKADLNVGVADGATVIDGPEDALAGDAEEAKNDPDVGAAGFVAVSGVALEAKSADRTCEAASANAPPIAKPRCGGSVARRRSLFAKRASARRRWARLSAVDVRRHAP